LQYFFRTEARRLFVANVPEILSNLVGQQSARRGALKVFDALQESKLNKQLFYVSDIEFYNHQNKTKFFFQELLEVVLYEIFPKELNSQHV
jgi:hypothetical protein